MDHLNELNPPVTIKPLSCCKCGNQKIEIHQYSTTQKDAPWRLVCQKCQQTVAWFKTLQEAVEEWNKANTVLMKK